MIFSCSNQVKIIMYAKKEYEFPFEQQTIREVEPNYRHKIMQDYLEDDVVNRGMGCMYGAFIGDSLGSYLEFVKDKDFQQRLLNVMEMPGGGVFNLKAGQITDDSEMAYHLLKALSTFDPKNRFDQESNNLIITIANQYLHWYQSKPFDIGITCRTGLAVISSIFANENINTNTAQFTYGKQSAKNLVQKILDGVKAVSIQSQSNGSLMRIAPMAFYLGLITRPIQNEQITEVGLSISGMIDLIKNQASLLHPNPTNIKATELWVLMLVCFIKREQDRHLRFIYEHVRSQMEKKLGWGQFSTNPQNLINAKQHIGWSKIAISLGFESLYKITSQQNIILSQSTYEEHIFEVLARGGDTDTNAAIVGGMLGALIGFKKLPKKYLKKMMDVRFQSSWKNPRRENRPTCYEPRVAFATAFNTIRKWFPGKST